MEFIIVSKKSKEAIVKILQENTSPQRESGSCRFFNGQILEDSFKIRRNINYRNSFLPVINGVLEETDYGTKVTIKARMESFVRIFMYIWFGIISLACIVTLFSDLEFPFKFIPYFMLFAGILTAVLQYKYEIKKAKAMLEEILE